MTDTNALPPPVAHAIETALAGDRTGQELFHAVLDALGEVPGIEAKKSPLFRLNEYEIRVAGPKQIATEVQVLTQVGEWGIVAAPRVVANVPLDEHTSVLVLRYQGTPGERLVSGDGHGSFLDAAKAQFRRDMQTLADKGRFHAGARGAFHWLVGKQSGTLFLERWPAVKEGDADEIAESLRRVDAILDSH